jgi:sec-independent protein translocase protein TatA
MELVIVGIIAVLLFGKRLPEVGRSLGKGLVEFKRGMRDIQQEMDTASYADPPRTTHRNAIDDYDQATAPKFEPPVAAAQEAPPADSASQV